MSEQGDKKQDGGSEGQNTHEIVLSSNKTLDDLIEAIGSQAHDFDAAARHFSSLGVGYDPGHLTGSISEVELDLFLKNYSEDNGEIVHQPVTDGDTRGRFRFRKTPTGGYEVDETNEQDSFVQYDALILADGLPVVFELKLGNESSSSGGRQRSSAISLGRIARIAEPLKEYFETEVFGYAVIFPQESLSLENSSQNEFRQIGGRIVPFPMPSLDYRLEILRLKSVYKL